MADANFSFISISDHWRSVFRPFEYIEEWTPALYVHCKNKAKKLSFASCIRCDCTHLDRCDHYWCSRKYWLLENKTQPSCAEYQTGAEHVLSNGPASVFLVLSSRQYWSAEKKEEESYECRNVFSRLKTIQKCSKSKNETSSFSGVFYRGYVVSTHFKNISALFSFSMRRIWKRK